jgi:hypothetical protein
MMMHDFDDFDDDFDDDCMMFLSPSCGSSLFLTMILGRKGRVIGSGWLG